MKRYKEYLANVAPCFYYGIACGAMTGLLIFLFKFVAKKAEHLSIELYSLAKSAPLYICVAFAAIIACGVLMSLLHKKVPECKGGGIPRSEGVLRGILSFRWLKTLLGTFFGSVISFFCGIPVGSEGPAVLMGTSVGCMCGSVSKNKTTWNRYIMTGGAGAGFAVATGAPLSGILFALEEIHKRFTPMLVITVSISVVSATGINQLLCSIFGMDTHLLHVEALGAFELSHIGYLVLLGIVTAIAVGVFDASIAVFGRFTKKYSGKFSGTVKIVFVFIVTGILAFVFSDGVYSGHDVILDAASGNKTVMFLAVLLVVRLVMMILVTGSGTTGGIFIPTLAIGALVAALAAKLLVVIGMPSELYYTVVLLGMCAFIGGTLRAPLTASVLFLELTGQFTSLIYVAVVIFTVNFITELFNQKPFYDIALENMEHAQNKGRKPRIACFGMKVSEHAFVIGKTVRDIMWPPSSVVISITRADETRQDMDNDGEKRLYAGDTLVVRAKFFDEADVIKQLSSLVGNDDIKEVEM